MRRAALVIMVVVGAVGLGEAGERKLPKALSLVQRQPKVVNTHASLREEGVPDPMSLVKRQPKIVNTHASLRDEGVPNPMSLVKRMPQDVEIHPAVRGHQTQD